MKQDIKEHLCTKGAELVKTGLDGMSIAARLTDIVDEILVSAYESATGGFDGQPSASGNRKRQSINRLCPLKLCLVAVGGYGRREIAPYSDIDIMLLSKDRNSVNTDAAHSVLYNLWDTGLNISHSFRTHSECVEDSMSDLKTRTSLIESRFLAGSPEVFGEFRRDIYQKLLFKNKKEFIKNLLGEIDRRHRAYGGSVYMLEPNVKEGGGGLRDIHCLSWLSRVSLRINDIDELKKILHGNDYLHFIKAYDFLLKARLCLHALSRRRNDILSFDFQETVAGMFGFKKTKRFLSEEILMRLYYKKADSVTSALKNAMVISGSKHMNSHAGLASDFSIRKVADNFYISRSEIVVKDRLLFKNTDRILEAFYVYSTTGKRFSRQVREAIRSRFLFVNKKTRSSSKAVKYFFEILKGDRVYETLREMHDTGILDRFIPEFGRLRRLVIYEPYHKYTVDEHILIAIKNLEALKKTKDAKYQRLSGMMKGIRQDVLYLSILLHDIGKGGASAHFIKHEDSGYGILKGVLERLDIKGSDRKKIEFLVKNHILLSKLALTRDADAPETVVQLAETAENEENLNALYLMTYADMTAVNPYFWTEWKAYLLHDVYTKTKDYLSGIKTKSAVTADRSLRRFIEDMPERYLLSSTDYEIQSDSLLAAAARTEGVAVAVKELPDNSAEISLSTEDLPGLFSKIVGVLSFRGLNIARARLYSGKSGFVIDRISLSNWKEIWWGGIEEEIRNDLKRAILKREHVAVDSEHSLQKRAGKPVPQMPAGPVYKRFGSFIEIDNEASPEHTLLEAFLPDRLGLLYDISIRLYLHGADIISAVINTEDDIAHDVFYLQKGGGKLAAGTVLSIIDALQDVVTGEKDSSPLARAGGL